MSDKTPGTITTPKAALMLQITIPQVQQLFRAGEITAVRVPGRGWTTTKQAVEDYLRRTNAKRGR